MSRFQKCLPTDRRRARGRRAPARQVPTRYVAPLELEPEREALWIEEELGRDLPRRRPRRGAPKWSPPVELGNIRLRARAGSRAAYVRLAEGLYLVGEVPDTIAREEIGFVGPGMINKALQSITDRIEDARQAAEERRARREAEGLPVRPRAGERRQLVDRGARRSADLDVDDVGCARCNCRSCRGR